MMAYICFSLSPFFLNLLCCLACMVGTAHPTKSHGSTGGAEMTNDNERYVFRERRAVTSALMRSIPAWVPIAVPLHRNLDRSSYRAHV